MDKAIQKRVYTYSEYLELEQATGIRHEYWNGEVFAMAGGTKNHSRIILNTGSKLMEAFAPKGCSVFTESVKLEIEKEKYYLYPDIILTCHDNDTDAYVAHSPGLIAEVISKSTENYDRSAKLKRYRTIPSLRYYLLISQTNASVEVYARNSEDTLFTYDVVEGLDAFIDLPAIEFRLALADIYRYIVFVPEP
jgi:Uma2 family endonuclease